ncbi:MAG: DUF3179 domain-containing protein [Planctomycetaceae bacterium]
MNDETSTTTTATTERRRYSWRDWSKFTIIAVLLAVIGGACWEIGAQFLELPEHQLLGQGNSRFRTALADPPFDFSKIAVDRKEILSGGPPKDGIPALTDPEFISAKDADYLKPDDRVIGVAIGDDVRAYPLAILNYHEIVNDTVNETPIAVTYCPLCDSAAVFDRRTPLGEREFGVSGMLYNSNVLMFDRKGKPESLWSQVKTQGMTGPAMGKSLKALPLELTTWKDWSRRYPETQVMSVKTGHNRNYRSNPYFQYFNGPDLMFPAEPSDDRLPKKSRVLGVWTGKKFRAYPESIFDENHTRIDDEWDGKKISIEYDPDTKSMRVLETDEGLQWMYSFWFAWYALHPETDVYK